MQNLNYIKSTGRFMNNQSKKIAVIDYGLGNLFSVERAFRYIGAEVKITSEAKDIQNADYLVLPGVGAFGDGMKGLIEKNLIEPITEFVNGGRPFLGICLGMQLLMTSSEEFGEHQGLNLVSGRVIRLTEGNERVKVPHVGWNSLMLPEHIQSHKQHEEITNNFWDNTLLKGINPGMFVYFVHSYMVVPDDTLNILAETKYGDNVFCSVLRKRNIFACQFHPERSGKVGLEIYKQFLRS